jgi:hypothetical protein
MTTHAAATQTAQYPPAVRRVQAAALDTYLALEEEAADLSSRKCAARDAVIALGNHGDIIAASDNRSRKIVNETVATNQHAKVVARLRQDYNIPQAVIDALYVETAGSKHDRDLKKV